MSKQRTRFVEEKDTVYEIDENCMRQQNKTKNVSDTSKERKKTPFSQSHRDFFTKQ